MRYEILNGPLKGFYKGDIQEVLREKGPAGPIPSRIMDVIDILYHEKLISTNAVVEISPGRDMGDGCLYPSVAYFMPFTEGEYLVQSARVSITATQVAVKADRITMVLDLQGSHYDLHDEVSCFFEQVKDLWGIPQSCYEDRMEE